MTDWSKERGIADEAHIDRFIASIGGERLDVRFPNASFQNADYIFPDKKILIELKVLETEFGATDEFKAKADGLIEDIARNFGFGPIVRGEKGPSQFYAKAKRNLFRAPLGRIVKKANRQLRESKAALSDDGYRGLLWVVNDNFRAVGTELAIHLLCSTLGRQNSNVDGLIYVTNHYVDIPGDDYARLVWVPAYADGVEEDLPDFVDWLGGAWFRFQESEIGPFDDRQAGPDLTISGARPIL